MNNRGRCMHSSGTDKSQGGQKIIIDHGNGHNRSLKPKSVIINLESKEETFSHFHHFSRRNFNSVNLVSLCVCLPLSLLHLTHKIIPLLEFKTKVWRSGYREWLWLCKGERCVEARIGDVTTIAVITCPRRQRITTYTHSFLLCEFQRSHGTTLHLWIHI